MLKSVNGGICPAGYYNGLDAVAVQQFFIQHLHSSIKVCRVSWCQQSHLRLKFQTINSNWLKFVSYTASLGEIIYMDGGGIRSAGCYIETGCSCCRADNFPSSSLNFSIEVHKASWCQQGHLWLELQPRNQLKFKSCLANREIIYTGGEIVI